jgi:hypothetical protein
LRTHIHKIDEKLDEIQLKIDDLENEKQSLLAIRHEYQKQIKCLIPSSNGGCLDDNSSNWNKTGLCGSNFLVNSNFTNERVFNFL